MTSPKFEVPSVPIKCVRTSSHLDVYVYYECSVATRKLLGCTHALRGQGEKLWLKTFVCILHCTLNT